MKHLIILLYICLPLMAWGQSTMDVLNRMHQVKKGETMFSVSQHYQITVEELRAANPSVKKDKLKAGSFLTIPQKQAKPQHEANQDAPSLQTASSQHTEEAQIATRYETVKVGVLLPLEEGNDKSRKMLEFYQGLLMAADSVKREGTNLDIYTYSSGTTEARMQALVDNMAELKQMHVIFGPGEVAQLPILSRFCNQHHIRLVLPFSHTAQDIGYPLLYNASPVSAITAPQAAMLATRHFTGRNYILLKTNEEDYKGKLFTAAITQQLAQRNESPRLLNIEADSIAFATALSPDRENCLIPDNTGIKALNILLSRINDFRIAHPDYKIALLGYPEWLAYTDKLLTQYYANDTYVYSSFYFNALTEPSIRFQKAFMSHFGKTMLPIQPRYAMMGFDLGYHFMHGLAAKGDTFETTQESLIQHPFQHTWQFVQETEGGERNNHFVQLIHYTPEQKIELVR